MNRTSSGTNALRHGSCRALVCRCRRALAAVVGGPIPLHAPYVTSTTLTTGNDDIPTHATVCRQRLPLASTTHHSCYSCCQRLPLASPTYYYPPMLCTIPFLPPPPAGSAPLAMPSWGRNRPTDHTVDALLRRSKAALLQPINHGFDALLRQDKAALLQSINRGVWRPLAPLPGCPLATGNPRCWRPLATPQGCPLATYNPRF
jgi:hypothetical protein